MFFGVEPENVPESLKSNQNVRYLSVSGGSMAEMFEKEIVCKGKIHIHLDLEAIKEADGVTQTEAQSDPNVSHFGAKSNIPDDTPMFRAKDIVNLA